MKAQICGMICLQAGLILCNGRTTDAHLVVEPISAAIGNQPGANFFEQYYPNEFDPNHPKELKFTGMITNADLNQPTFVDLWFDWIDNINFPTPTPQTSPVFPLNFEPDETQIFSADNPITFTIPFCPPQVSIHIQNNGPGSLVLVDGTFTHECLHGAVPEPAMLLISSLLVLMAPLALRGLKDTG